MRLRKAISLSECGDSTYVLRFERNEIEFLPGQHLNVGVLEDEDRPYSTYSGFEDDYFEILIKEGVNGSVSGKLKFIPLGEIVSIASPHDSLINELVRTQSAKVQLIGEYRLDCVNAN